MARMAQDRILRVRADQAVKVDEEDTSADFSSEQPVQSIGTPVTVAFDRAAWEPIVVELSQRVNATPEVEVATARISVSVLYREFRPVPSHVGLLGERVG